MSFPPDYKTGVHSFYEPQSDHLIITISMYRGLVMQDKEENFVFLNPNYRCVNERLAEYKEEGSTVPFFQPSQRVDQMSNFFRLMLAPWKDEQHEFRIMAAFIESITKAFDFKMELAIHDLVLRKEEFCLLQVGFLDESEEALSPNFLIYQYSEVASLELSTRMEVFFILRELNFSWIEEEPEDLRINDFWQEERNAVSIHGVYLYVNKCEFLKEYEDKSVGLHELKKIMDEFYADLDEFFRSRNESLKEDSNEELDKDLDTSDDRKKKKPIEPLYMKARLNQFFVRYDDEGVELLDFVHLKIWNYPEEYDFEHVILNHLPDLEFEYANCSEEEYEFQKERLRYVL